MTDRPHFVNSSDNPTASADLVALGSQLRELRISRAITLEVLSERTGFSKGYLSRIENGRKTPPLGSLARIAVALGTTVSKMLNQQPSEVSSDSSPFFSIVRKADRARVVTGASAFGYDYVSLSRAAHGSPQLQPLIFTFPKEVDKFVFFEHEGEEFMFILSGRVEWQISHEKHTLEAGDCIHFDARLPHRGRALDDEAVALVVTCPADSGLRPNGHD